MTHVSNSLEFSNPVTETTKSTALSPDKLAEILGMPSGQPNAKTTVPLQVAQMTDSDWFRQQLNPNQRFDYDQRMNRDERYDYRQLNRSERQQYDGLTPTERYNLRHMDSNQRYDCLHDGKCDDR